MVRIFHTIKQNIFLSYSASFHSQIESRFKYLRLHPYVAANMVGRLPINKTELNKVWYN